MKAKEYFIEQYGVGHLEDVVKLNDIVSLYGLIEEYSNSRINHLEIQLIQQDHEIELLKNPM